MKKFKGAAAALLAINLLVASPVWADTVPAPAAGVSRLIKMTEIKDLSGDQKQALAKIYDLIPELKSLTMRNAYYEPENGQYKDSWTVFFSDGAIDKGIPGIFVNLTFDNQTNQLLNCHIQNPQWASDQLPADNLAKEKATEFAAKVLGDQMKNYRLGSGMGYSTGSTTDDKGNEHIFKTAYVQFQPLINGIPLQGVGLQIAVDSFGHVTDFQMERDGQIDPAKFPDPTQAISQTAAEKIFAGMVKMKLYYQQRQPMIAPLNEKNNATKPVLMYVADTGAPIDAITGKPSNIYSTETITPEPLSLIGAGNKLLAKTPAEGARLLAQVFGVDMSGMKFTHQDDHENFYGSKVNNFSWSSESSGGDQTNMRYVNMETLADTGQVIGFNCQDKPQPTENATISTDTARQTAVNFLQKYLPTSQQEMQVAVLPNIQQLPEWVDKNKLDQQSQPPAEIDMNFVETHQGIPVGDRHYYIRVDAVTGKIVGLQWPDTETNLPLPDSTGIVSADAAKVEYLQQHPLELEYVWPQYMDQKSPAPQLLYTPSFSSGWSYIDAFTGKPVEGEK